MGSILLLDDVINELCIWYKLCLAQNDSQSRRLVLCLRHLAEKDGVHLTFRHLLHLYSSKVYRGVINMINWVLMDLL